MSLALQIAICEDNESDRRRLIEAIDASGRDFRIAAFADGSSMLKTFRQGMYQLIFMDIYLQEESGVDVTRAIRAIDPQVIIVFITSSLDFTREGYRLGALKYIEKPYGNHEVRDALELAQRLWDSREVCTLVTKDGKIDVPLEEIVYVEVSNHICILHLLDGEVTAYMNIESLEKLLPATHFVRCHRSFIVNLMHVQGVDRDFLMPGGERVYIRGKDEKKMERLFAQYLASQTREKDRIVVQ